MWEMIEKAYKQKEKDHCEDCISREAVINELKLGYFNKDLQEGKNDPCVIDAMIDWTIRTIKHQPSVKPQRPKAKIILVGNNPNFSPFDNSNKDILKCSNCLNEVLDSFMYCPMCGSEMRGVKIESDLL